MYFKTILHIAIINHFQNVHYNILKLIYFIVHRLDPPCGICALSKNLLLLLLLLIVKIVANGFNQTWSICSLVDYCIIGTVLLEKCAIRLILSM